MSTKIIGGATAQAWLDSGASELIAYPATFPGGVPNAPYSATDANATSQTTIDIFNAVDRDALNSGSFGIGVHNPYITLDPVSDGFVHTGQFPGITSTPTEIGYYPIGAAPDVKDTLAIKLDGPLFNSEATVSFFYENEGSSEALSYELYLNGVKVGEETILSDNNVHHSPSEPGYFSFKLDGFTGAIKAFDEVRFSGAPQTITQDASDFLVENIKGETAEGLSLGYWRGHTAVWDQSSENNDITTTDSFSAYFNFAALNTNGVSASILGGPGGLTLLETLSLSGNGELALAKQAVTALININSDLVDNYPMTQADLVSQVDAALVGNNATTTAALTSLLDTYNKFETDWV